MNEQTNTAMVPAYPVVNFQTALETAAAVSEAGGVNSDVPKSVIASQLQVSDSSGAFIQRLSTARSYGMIHGRGAYKLTPEARRYFFPASLEEKKRALLSFLSSPPLFAEIIKRFDGNKVPPIEMLANILHREFKIGESWKERVAGFFIKAASTTGVIDSSGFLRYRSAMQSSGSSTQVESTTEATAPATTSARSSNQSIGGHAATAGMNAWFYTLDDQMVRLETPIDELSPSLWAKLNAYVQVLKPGTG